MVIIVATVMAATFMLFVIGRRFAPAPVALVVCADGKVRQITVNADFD